MKPDWLLARYPVRETIGVLPRWSFSAWSTYKDVPYIAYADMLLGIPRKANAQANRGVAIHHALEQYALGQPYDCADPAFDAGRRVVDELMQAGEFSPERRFTLDRDWAIHPEEGKWMTAILDGLCIKPDGSAEVLDYKTGKAYAIKHTQQAQLYAAVVYRVLGIDHVTTRFIYLDLPDQPDLVITFNKPMLMEAFEYWDREGKSMTGAPKSVFAPPESLSGIAPWYAEYLKNPAHYRDEHFPAPWYVRANND